MRAIGRRFSTKNTSQEFQNWPVVLDRGVNDNLSTQAANCDFDRKSLN